MHGCARRATPITQEWVWRGRPCQPPCPRAFCSRLSRHICSLTAGTLCALGPSHFPPKWGVALSPKPLLRCPHLQNGQWRLSFWVLLKTVRSWRTAFSLLSWFQCRVVWGHTAPSFASSQSSSSPLTSAPLALSPPPAPPINAGTCVLGVAGVERMAGLEKAGDSGMVPPRPVSFPQCTHTALARTGAGAGPPAHAPWIEE